MASFVHVLLFVTFVAVTSARQWPSGCIPEIPTVPHIDPEARAGQWYNYMYLGEHPPRVNDALHSAKIGKGVVPGTRTKAMVANVQITWWTPDYKTCAGQYAQTYVTKDGREVMVVYNYDSPQPLSLTSYAFAENYTHWQLRFFCLEKDVQTNLCKNSNFFFNTRQRPDTLPPAVLAEYRAAVDRVLQPYCLSTNDFLTETWTTQYPVCAPNPSQCYSDLINGLAAQFGGSG
ncbi:uncharacterized protein LOC129595249 [Paramacrobiotus metropolitanus]|uniref:uncharacterized protein LOC129595249 n=1 Tax=Paramacrobiotus metropolitanus TaxID=2943436 RepID=UPI002445F40E|nr:uncharacterized protein LOC129595249 [Paramacrobiotus metropolitanus]